MRKGLKYIALTLLAVLAILLLVVIILWKSLPQWLPSVAKHWLPAGTSLRLAATPNWSNGQWQLPSLTYLAGDCILAQADGVSLQHNARQWRLAAAGLTVDSTCFSQLPASDEKGPALSLSQLQNTLPLGEVVIDKLTIAPWQIYAGSVAFDNDGKTQKLRYQGDVLNLNATLEQQQLTLNSFTLTPAGSTEPLTLSGQLQLPATFNTLPPTGDLQGEMQTSLVAKPLTATLHWQQTQGQLTLSEKGSSQPLAVLPWQLSDKQVQISQGQWHWPYAQQPLSGGVNLTLADWNEAFNQTTLSARLNVLTQGHNGKGNAVLTLGPGKLGLLQSNLDFQLTGQANLPALSLSASFPGTLTGSILSPEVALHSGALLRAWGQPTKSFTLQDARWPLAGVKITPQGVSGPLQAIVRAKDSYWGQFSLHLDGKSQQFWLDQGRWDFNYWGDGRLPPLGGKWDMAGKGNWQDERVTLTALSTGFDRLRYGLVDVSKPRLTLQQPLVWQRPLLNNPKPAETNVEQVTTLPPSLNGEIKLVAPRIAFNNGSYIPAAELLLQIKGINPQRFAMKGSLQADPIGPIRLMGSWDGERLRGEGWWPKQALSAFQTLLPPDLKIKLGNGNFYAQSAFSAARGQGFMAGGHWVVKNGSMWLKEGDVSGVDFSLSYRLKNQRWQLGGKRPITLRIGEVNNLFKMQNITADLQGQYPPTDSSPLTLNNLGVDMLGGHVGLSSLRVPQHQPAVLKLQKVDLSELFTALKPKQLAMSGRINGELPLYIDDPKWLVHNGWIANDGGLTLRLDPQFAEAMASANMANRMVVEWLRYLEIHRTHARVDLDNLGELTMSAQIDGLNNTDHKNREIILNYTHQENIYQLWRSLRFGDNLQEWLQQQVELPDAAASKDNEVRKP
ncbi:YdbH family protein [Rouxiella sp. Mn2063]|uniref:YdbH family protein n=1 Tax=Rouxiella sp. Mn2063 TaxID=3395262 RepID=UPI003BBE0EAF